MFWYLLPFLGIALLLALTLKQIPLSDTAGMVARGEAVGGEEAEQLEALRNSLGQDGDRDDMQEKDSRHQQQDDGELAGRRR